MMKLRSFIFLFLLIPSMLSAKTTIKVGYFPIFDHLPLLVSYAQNKAFFHNLDLQLQIFNTWDTLAEKLKAGEIDAAFILSPLAMKLFGEGTPIQALLLGHRNGSGITVKKELTIHSPMGLKGKKIAVPHVQSTHLLLLSKYLNDAGLSLKDISTPIIPPVKMFGALLAEEIDGFVVEEPFGTRARLHNLGKTLVLSKDILDHHIDCIVVIRQQLIETEPQTIQEWINSLIQAGQWIEQDKLKGSQAVAKLIAYEYLPYPETTLIAVLQDPPDRVTFDDLRPRLEDFQKIMEFSIYAKTLMKPIDLKKFVNDKFYLKSQKNQKDSQNKKSQKIRSRKE